MTRAEDHLLFAGSDDPNTFLEELPVQVDALELAVPSVGLGEKRHTQLEVGVPDSAEPDGYSPHSLMDDSVFEDGLDRRKIEFGSQVHEFAEDYALGKDVTPASEDEEHVEVFLDGLSRELRVEERTYLPLEIDGEWITLSGVIDLVHVTDDVVEIVDFKTDRSRHAESEYRIQLSVYYHVL